MWIMIIKCLPVKNPPPRYSIFWSTAWPSEDAMINKSLKLIQASAKYSARDAIEGDWPYDEVDNIKETDTYIFTPQDMMFGKKTPNWFGARAIIYQGEKIRIFPHEFTPQSNQNMHLFINQEQAYDFYPNTVAEERQVQLVLTGELRPIYEQALLDGANHNQALLTLLEQDITMPDADFPPMGYYVLKEEWAELLP